MNLDNHILAFQKGLSKAKRELRYYHYPSTNYTNCEKRIEQIEDKLRRLQDQKILQSKKLQTELF